MPTTDSDNQLYIGWASVSITPDGPAQLHGQHHERVSERVRDEVTATALALETRSGDNGIEQAIVISCDLVAITREVQQRVREAARANLPGFDVRKLFLATTHTHTAPVIQSGLYPPPGPGVVEPSDYADLLVDRLRGLAIAAWGMRNPGSVSTALSHAAVGFNRRVVYADGSAQMYGSSDTQRFVNIEGSQDHGVELLFTWDADKNLTGAVVNLACPSQVVEMENFISADFWGAARAELKSTCPFVLPQCSAAGDQSPRDLVRRGRREADFRGESGLKEMGRRIAAAVMQGLSAAAPTTATSLAFAHEVLDLDLPARAISQAEFELTKKTCSELAEQQPKPGSSDGGRLRKAEAVIERYKQQNANPRFPMELHVLRLGDIALATNPFELYLDYGARIKARSAAMQTFVVQLACDRGMYLPTAKAISGGSYGSMATESYVGPEGGQMLVDRTVEVVNRLFEE